MPDYNFSGVDDYAKAVSRPPGEAATATTDSEGLSSTLGRLIDPLLAIGKGYRDYVAPAATQAVQTGLESLPFSQDPGSQQAIGGLAKFVVPQSATGAGIMAGSLATGGMGLGLGLGGRLLGAATGGLVGGATEGAPLMGAAEGLGAGLAGEALAYPLSAGLRAGFQQGRDVSRIGSALEDISPALRNAGTATSLNQQVAERAQPELSAALEQGLQSINRTVGGATFQSSAIAAAFPDAPANLSFLDAAKYIRYMGAQGWSRSSGNAAGGLGGATARDLRSEAIDEIKAQLPPDLASAWTRYTSDYGKGKILLDLLQEPDVLYSRKAGAGFSGLNVPALQAKASQYYTEGDLAKRLTPAELRLLESAVQRGDTFSAGTDRPGFALPFIRAYPGAGTLSLGEALPLTPTRYIGNPLNVPAAPFSGIPTNLADNYLNPYRRR